MTKKSMREKHTKSSAEAATKSQSQGLSIICTTKSMMVMVANFITEKRKKKKTPTIKLTHTIYLVHRLIN
jgi:hypothetical protein